MNDLGRLESLAARYTIDRAIGAGGMATVYVADDVRHGRRVPQPEHIVFVENVFDELRAKLRKSDAGRGGEPDKVMTCG